MRFPRLQVLDAAFGSSVQTEKSVHPAPENNVRRAGGGGTLRVMQAMETANLIGAYLRGEPPAIRQIDEWLRRAASPFRKRLRADWEDVLQEVRVEVFRLLEEGRFRPEASLRTYLWHVTAHNCIDAVRRQRRGPPVVRQNRDDLRPARGPSPLDTLVEREREQARSALLEAAPIACRDLWKLILSGVSYREISRRLGVSEGALRVRAHRCRKQAAGVADRAAGAAARGRSAVTLTRDRKARIDYVPIDTSINFDKALMEYLLQRQRRF